MHPEFAPLIRIWILGIIHTMTMRYTYHTTCPNPELRFHIEHSVFNRRAFSVHTHDFSELVLVRHGRGTHIFEGREYPLSSGDVFVVSPNQQHGYRDIEGIDLCNIIYDPEIYLPTGSDLQSLPGYHALFHIEPLLRHDHAFTSRLLLNKEQMLRVYELLDPLEKEYRTQQPGFESVIRSYFTIMVTYLSRQFTIQDTTGSRELLALSRVIAHIESRYAEPIRLDDLAATAIMSKNSLLRAFNRCYGSTPIDYLIRYRLEKARELLVTTRQSITEIAFAVGFSDSSYFGRKFRDQYSVSPRIYRNGLKDRLLE